MKFCLSGRFMIVVVWKAALPQKWQKWNCGTSAQFSYFLHLLRHSFSILSSFLFFLLLSLFIFPFLSASSLKHHAQPVLLSKHRPRRPKVGADWLHVALCSVFVLAVFCIPNLKTQWCMVCFWVSLTFAPLFACTLYVLHWPDVFGPVVSN